MDTCSWTCELRGLQVRSHSTSACLRAICDVRDSIWTCDALPDACSLFFRVNSISDMNDSVSPHLASQSGRPVSCAVFIMLHVLGGIMLFRIIVLQIHFKRLNPMLGMLLRLWLVCRRQLHFVACFSLVDFVK